MRAGGQLADAGQVRGVRDRGAQVGDLETALAESRKPADTDRNIRAARVLPAAEVMVTLPRTFMMCATAAGFAWAKTDDENATQDTSTDPNHHNPLVRRMVIIVRSDQPSHRQLARPPASVDLLPESCS